MCFDNVSGKDSQHLCKTCKQAGSALNSHLSSTYSDTDAVRWS